MSLLNTKGESEKINFVKFYFQESNGAVYGLNDGVELVAGNCNTGDTLSPNTY